MFFSPKPVKSLRLPTGSTKKTFVNNLIAIQEILSAKTSTRQSSSKIAGTLGSSNDVIEKRKSSFHEPKANVHPHRLLTKTTVEDTILSHDNTSFKEQKSPTCLYMSLVCSLRFFAVKKLHIKRVISRK